MSRNSLVKSIKYLQRIYRILGNNNYPKRLIDKMIANVRSKNIRVPENSYAYLSFNDTANNTMPNTEQSQHYASIAYVPGLSESISRSCEYFVPELKMAMRPHSKNGFSFTNLKSKIPKGQTSGVVYKVDCDDCNASYVGETTQKLCVRMAQHEYDSRKTHTTKNHSALAKHAINNKHKFKFDDVSILAKERNKTKLQIQEVNQIIKYESTVCNDKSDKKDYSNAYYNLIKMGFNNA